VEDSCLQRNHSQTKVASGISVFLMEELGDARLRCAQLKKYLDEAVKLIEKSGERDHFFEVAAHLIHGIPDTLLRMDKALSAAAMAAAKMDYEEIKDSLRPEKVEELEKALEDVRIRRVQRRSKEVESCMKIPEAVARLEHLAASIEATGTVNASELSSLIVSLEGQSVKKASATTEIADVLRNLSASLLDTSDPENRPSRVLLAATLRRVLGDTMDLKTAGFGPLKIRNREHGSGVPVVAFTAALEQAAENLFTCRGENDAAQSAVADALTGRVARIGPLTGMPNDVIALADKVRKSAYELRHEMGSVAKDMEYLAKSVKKAVPEAERYDVKYAAETVADDTKESRFEEGKPADPTKQMSPEDAAEWKKQTEAHKDEFKAATVADDTKESRFEEGKPADPTENMDADDAKKWKQQTEEHKDDFKAASAREEDILYETANLYLFQTPRGLEIRLNGPTHAVVVGKPNDITSAKRSMDRMERYPDKLRAMYKLSSDKEAASGDPRWIHAKYPGKTQDGEAFKKGDLVLYWPSSKSFMAGKKAEDAWRKFESEVADEDVYNSSREASTLAEQLVESRFEEGKPADPTENMDADDAKKWKQQTEEHKDDFKTAAAEKDDFYTAYDQLADQSKVDAPGGSEYSRVRRDWLSRPDHERMSAADLKAFIVWRANLQLGDLKSDPKGKIPKTANDGAWKVDAGFRKTPVGWTEKEGRWLSDVEYADGDKWSWEIREEDGSFQVRVTAPKLKALQGKESFDSLAKAKKFAAKYIDDPQGGERLNEGDLRKFFSQAKQASTQDVWKA